MAIPITRFSAAVSMMCSSMAISAGLKPNRSRPMSWIPLSTTMALAVLQWFRTTGTMLLTGAHLNPTRATRFLQITTSSCLASPLFPVCWPTSITCVTSKVLPTVMSLTTSMAWWTTWVCRVQVSLSSKWITSIWPPKPVLRLRVMQLKSVSSMTVPTSPTMLWAQIPCGLLCVRMPTAIFSRWIWASPTTVGRVPLCM